MPRRAAFFTERSTVLSAIANPNDIRVIIKGSIKMSPQPWACGPSTKPGSAIAHPASAPRIPAIPR